MKRFLSVKKIIAFMLAIIMLVSCSTILPSCQKTDDSEEKTEKTEKSVKQELCDLIRLTGVKYAGTYKILEVGDNYSLTISCTEQDDIIFTYCNYGPNNNSSFAELKFHEGSATQTVDFEYQENGYTCHVTGKLYTETVRSETACTLSNVTYRENFPSSTSQSSIDYMVNNLSNITTKTMLSGVHYKLFKDYGIMLNDLGFTNW